MKQTTMVSTAQLFYAHCNKLSLTTNILIAEAFGVNPSTVSRWISGDTPLPSWANKILLYLESTIEQRNNAINWQRKYNDLASTLQMFKRTIDNL